MSRNAAVLLGLALGPVALVLLDFLITQQVSGSFSQDVRETARATSVFSLPVGVLIGHWYYPGTRHPPIRKPWNLLVVVVISAFVMSASLPLRDLAAAPHFVAAASFVAGFAMGMVLWPMGEEQPRQ